MAKRGGSELNHENWDREDEKEDAGNFQAASADELKGRVIKRARRRNIGDGAETKNAFASFGGFGGKSESQAASFSFGQTGTESSDKPSAFAGFGLSQSSDQKSVFGSQPVNFGSSNDSQKVKTSSFGSEAFSFGSSKSSSTAGVGGGTFSLSSGSSFSFSGSSAGKSEAVFGAATSLPPAGVTAPTPATPEKTVTASPIKSDFSSFKPVSSPETSSFKFGAAGGAAPAPAGTVATSLFSFGTSKTSDPPPLSGGFVFGSKTPVARQEPHTSKSESSGFTFGESKPAAAEKDSEKDKKDLSASPGFLFGKKESSPQTPSFSFNSEKNSETNKDQSAKVVTVSSNSVAKQTNSNSLASVSKPSSKHSPEYLSHLKALNNQVLAWLKMHIESNPLVILSPVFKDYESHLEDINKKYGDQVVKATEHAIPEQTLGVSKEKEQPKEMPKAFSFGSSNAVSATATTSSSSGSAFSFSSSTAKIDNPTSGTAPAFSFSVNSAAPAPTFGAFSFGSGASAITPLASTTAPAATEAEEDEDQPPVVEVKQVEEHDALYSKKCKLFYKKDGQYKEKGVGMLYLKSIDDGNKSQLLVRADTNLGNVLLNILLSSQMATTRVGKNNVMIVCVPNPPIDPKVESSEPCPMLLR